MNRWIRCIVLGLCFLGCQHEQGAESALGRDGALAKLVLRGASDARCAVPPLAQAKSAVVVVRVMVLADGTPQHVEVTKSSVEGQGFEAAAEGCALHYRYRPATDAAGNSVRNWSHEFNVKFYQLPERPRQI